MVKSRKRRRSTPLDRSEILDAAVALADTEGIEALSMRRLARQVGVQAMSLYNHVQNKDEVLEGMVEIVVGHFEVPAEGDWREAMRRRATTTHEVLLRHPWATMLLVSRINVGPNHLRHVEATIGCLRGAGFSWPVVDYAWNALDSYVFGFTLQKLNFPLQPDEYVGAAEDHLALIPPESFPNLHEMTQELMSGAHDGVNALPFGLELLLDGLERLRSAT